MAYPQTAPVQPLGVPVKGMNTRDPLANMSPEYAPWVLNMEPEPQYLKVRGGWVSHATLTDQTWIVGLGNYAETSLFAYAVETTAFNRIYNVTAAGSQAAAAAVHTCGAGSPNDMVSVRKYGTRLAFMGTTDPANKDRYTTGGAFAATGWTVGGAAFYSRIGTIYKGRAYFFNSSTPTMYYSTLAGVTGALTTIDFTSLFQEGGGIIWANVLTSPQNTPTESYLAFGNASGEVLVYAGDDPGATNWELIGRFKTPRPIYYNASLQYRNDVLVCTEAGVISLRKLFSASSEGNQDLTISSPIDSYWTNLVRQLNLMPAGIFQSCCAIEYCSDVNKIYVCIDGHLRVDGSFVNPGSSSTIFAYNTISQGWTIQEIPQSGSNSPGLVYFKGALYKTIKHKVYKYALSTYKDESIGGVETAIPYALHSAYIPGQKDQNQVSGFEPIMKTDFTGSSVTIKASADFGRKLSAASSQTLLTAGGYQNPFYRVGVDGKFYQYRLEGNSDVASTTGLELYNMGVAVK